MYSALPICVQHITGKHGNTVVSGQIGSTPV